MSSILVPSFTGNTVLVDSGAGGAQYRSGIIGDIWWSWYTLELSAVKRIPISLYFRCSNFRCVE